MTCDTKTAVGLSFCSHNFSILFQCRCCVFSLSLVPVCVISIDGKQIINFQTIYHVNRNRIRWLEQLIVRLSFLFAHEAINYQTRLKQTYWSFSPFLVHSNSQFICLIVLQFNNVAFGKRSHTEMTRCGVESLDKRKGKSIDYCCWPLPLFHTHSFSHSLFITYKSTITPKCPSKPNGLNPCPIGFYCICQCMWTNACLCCNCIGEMEHQSSQVIDTLQILKLE